MCCSKFDYSVLVVGVYPLNDAVFHLAEVQPCNWCFVAVLLGQLILPLSLRNPLQGESYYPGRWLSGHFCLEGDFLHFSALYDCSIPFSQRGFCTFCFIAVCPLSGAFSSVADIEKISEEWFHEASLHASFCLNFLFDLDWPTECTRTHTSSSLQLCSAAQSCASEPFALYFHFQC